MELPDIRLFGSPIRTSVLVLTGMLEETYPQELARLLGQRPYPVARIVNALETEGVLSTRRLGVERRVTLNPSYIGFKELRDLLRKIGNSNRSYLAILSRERRRPRRARKPLHLTAKV